MIENFLNSKQNEQICRHLGFTSFELVDYRLEPCLYGHRIKTYDIRIYKKFSSEESIQRAKSIKEKIIRQLDNMNDESDNSKRAVHVIDIKLIRNSHVPLDSLLIYGTYTDSYFCVFTQENNDGNCVFLDFLDIKSREDLQRVCILIKQDLIKRPNRLIISRKACLECKI